KDTSKDNLFTSTIYNYASAAFPSLTRSLSDVFSPSLSSFNASTPIAYDAVTGSVLK
ncbi:hypothetical protein K523DRAFT_396238, partial [Schizophyllum commune Tattone D]